MRSFGTRGQLFRATKNHVNCVNFQLQAIRSYGTRRELFQATKILNSLFCAIHCGKSLEFGSRIWGGLISLKEKWVVWSTGRWNGQLTCMTLHCGFDPPWSCLYVGFSRRVNIGSYSTANNFLKWEYRWGSDLCIYTHKTSDHVLHLYPQD